MTTRKTLAQQLAELRSAPSLDPEEGSYDSLAAPVLAAGKEHYVEVGPSRLARPGDEGGRYAGKRVKIYDDDEDEGDDDGVAQLGSDKDEDGLDDSAVEDEDENDSENLDEDEEEEEEDEDDDGEDEDEPEDDEATGYVPGGDAEEQDAAASSSYAAPRANGHATLDPLANIRESRSREAAKGRAIREQKVSPSRVTSPSDSQLLREHLPCHVELC